VEWRDESPPDRWEGGRIIQQVIKVGKGGKKEGPTDKEEKA